MNDLVEEKEFVWEAANVYFLLTDRFYNGDKEKKIYCDRTRETAKLRGFEGGNIKGVTQKIQEGYFTQLGINAIWMTPIVEQIHGGTDEGSGVTYAYHGYWAKDWSTIDPNFGTKADLKELVDTAHKNGIRILLDVVINHRGPVTEKDPVWPSDWVRTGPQCKYNNFENTVSCTLVKNLPDIKTENNENVDLPPQLIAKWKEEGRYEEELSGLEAFFNRTKYPKAPRFYIMKWLTDYISEFGVDGFRVDTVKHTEESVWREFRRECDFAFSEYKKKNPEKVLDTNGFYLVGEVYGYAVSQGKYYNFGDRQVNYFDKAFDSLINFEFKWNAKQLSENEVFEKYNSLLHNELKGYGVLNYLTSHDDDQPFDRERKRPYKTATMLMLTPGTSQIYYGDESARSLIIEGASGDATLRSCMNWKEINTEQYHQGILNHWQKLGQFRANHMSVGAGKHQLISEEKGLVFSRVRNKDKVVVGINLVMGDKYFNVSSVFNDGEKLRDFYSNQTTIVANGTAFINSNYSIVLLERFTHDTYSLDVTSSEVGE